MDDLVRKNAFEIQLAAVVVNGSMTREAISRADMRKFLEFVRQDKHFCKYYDGMYILFHTGLRISEFVGLTVKDIDFSEMKIHVPISFKESATWNTSLRIPRLQAVPEMFP